MTEISVIEPGTEVTVGEDIVGIILCVSISAQKSIQYQVAWWNGNTRITEWLDGREITCAANSRCRIGFAYRN